MQRNLSPKACWVKSAAAAPVMVKSGLKIKGSWLHSTGVSLGGQEGAGGMEGAECARSRGGQVSAESQHTPGKGEEQLHRKTANDTSQHSRRLLVSTCPVKLLTANRTDQTNSALHRDAYL